jgi:gluconolactonase
MVVRLLIIVAAIFVLTDEASPVHAHAFPVRPETNRSTSAISDADRSTSFGMPGRTLGLSAICDVCNVEKYSSECVGRLEGPNFDNDGNLWMVSPRTGDIYRVTPDRQCQSVAQTPGPNGTRFAPDGKLYGVDKLLGLFWIDLKTYEVTFITNQSGHANFHGLDDLYFDSKGGAYVTDAYGSSVLDPKGQVFYFTPNDGVVRKVIGGNLAFPNGVALSPDEKTLYVADWSTNRIIAVPVVGPGELLVENAWVFAYLNGGHGPDSMAIDEAGNLYAAHYGAGEVVIFDPHGFYYGAIRLPKGAGMIVSNIVLHENYLYITEMDQHTVWRVAVKHHAAAVGAE